MAPSDADLAEDGFDVRVEWGPQGLRRLAPVADVLVVVDVLSFTTCVSVALEAGAEVLPYRLEDDGGPAFAVEHGARFAGRRSDGDEVFSLSPASLRGLPAGSRIVLPSPNGSALSFAARDHGAGEVVAGCLRNASAVAAHCARRGKVIGIVPAGERWRGATGPMRVSIEDLLGAGAVVAALPVSRSRSPEAAAAGAAFGEAAASLAGRLRSSPSGRELAGQGFAADVELAADHDATTIVPVLDGNRFRPAALDPRPGGKSEPQPDGR